MKKTCVIWAALVCIFALTACGTISLDKIKTKYKESGYSCDTYSQDVLDKIAGADEGFKAYRNYDQNETSVEFTSDNGYLSVTIQVLKFSNESLADEYAAAPNYFNAGYAITVSQKKNYVCVITCVRFESGSSLGTDVLNAEETEMAIKTFEDCF